jgi:hypothetical protein
MADCGLAAGDGGAPAPASLRRGTGEKPIRSGGCETGGFVGSTAGNGFNFSRKIGKVGAGRSSVCSTASTLDLGL